MPEFGSWNSARYVMSRYCAPARGAAACVAPSKALWVIKEWTNSQVMSAACLDVRALALHALFNLSNFQATRSRPLLRRLPSERSLVSVQAAHHHQGSNVAL